MVHSAHLKGMSQHQLLLLEHALRQITKIGPATWDQIPLDLHPSFARYTCADAWTGRPDLLTLREAALMIIRDAIAGTGEFDDEAPVAAGTRMT